MSRVKPCRTCKPDDGSRFQRRGFTRHADRVCSWCRRYGPPTPTISYRGRGG